MKCKRCRHALGADGNDDGVASVVPTREARANVGVGRQDIHELAFTLVAPLRPKNSGHCTNDDDIAVSAHRGDAMRE